MDAHDDDQRRRFDEAKAFFLEGLRCQQAGDDLQAERCYLASLERLPGRVSTLVNLAAARLRLGRAADALVSAEAALAIEPGDADGLLHRGDALDQLGRRDEALAVNQQLLSLHPEHPIAWSRRGSLLRELQRPAEAAQAFREALRLGADAELNRFYLASVEAAAKDDSASPASPATPPRAYVEKLFDQYAGDFEHHLLQELGYDAHRRLIDLVRHQGQHAFASALDLGCGTGLCGKLLRPITQRLVGVDLSSRMLDEARKAGVYDRLEHADVNTWLAATEENHDLIVAADVFIYVGKLDEVFAGVARVALRGALFAFSVELADSDPAGSSPGYQLRPSLRYAHTRGYVEALAAQNRFETVALQDAPIRQDQGKAIDGLVAVLRIAS